MQARVRVDGLARGRATRLRPLAAERGSCAGTTCGPSHRSLTRRPPAASSLFAAAPGAPLAKCACIVTRTAPLLSLPRPCARTRTGPHESVRKQAVNHGELAADGGAAGQVGLEEDGALQGIVHLIFQIAALEIIRVRPLCARGRGQRRGRGHEQKEPRAARACQRGPHGGRAAGRGRRPEVRGVRVGAVWASKTSAGVPATHAC